MTFSQCLVVYIVFANLAPVSAAVISLAEVVPLTLRQNRDLMAARLAIDEANGRRRQAGRLTNPELEGEIKPLVSSTDTGNVPGQGTWSVGVMQRFPLTARLRFEREVSDAGLAAAVAEVREAERQLAGDALLMAVNRLALQSQRELKGRQATNSTELAHSARAIAAAGEGSPVDASQFELEAQESATEMLRMEIEQAALDGQLRSLLGIVPPEEVTISGTLGSPLLDAFSGTSPESRPDYQAALARRLMAERTLSLARANRWQDIGVGVFGEFTRSEDNPIGVVNDNYVGLRISLPLPFWNRNQGTIQQSAAAVQRADLEVAALALRINNEVDAARRQLEAATRLESGLASTLEPNSLELEQRLEKLRAEGQATLTDVLRARERRFRAESLRLGAQRDRARALVLLGTTTGEILPRPAGEGDHQRPVHE